jgi:hypothetical protein
VMMDTCVHSVDMFRHLIGDVARVQASAVTPYNRAWTSTTRRRHRSNHPHKYQWGAWRHRSKLAHPSWRMDRKCLWHGRQFHPRLRHHATMAL